MSDESSTATAERPKRRTHGSNGKGNRTGRSRRDVAKTTGQGAPSFCTPARTKAIVKAVSQGLSLPDAAKLAGVSPDTVRQWIAKGYGEKECPDDTIYRKFVEELQKAKAGIKSRLLGNVNRIADGESRAALSANQWLLGVLDKRYRQQQTVNHTGTVRQESVSLQLRSDLSPEHVAAILGAMRPAETETPAIADGRVIEVDPAAD